MKSENYMCHTIHKTDGVVDRKFTYIHFLFYEEKNINILKMLYKIILFITVNK